MHARTSARGHHVRIAPLCPHAVSVRKFVRIFFGSNFYSLPDGQDFEMSSVSDIVVFAFGCTIVVVGITRLSILQHNETDTAEVHSILLVND